jgi:hypothetical protein
MRLIGKNKAKKAFLKIDYNRVGRHIIKLKVK